VNRTIVRAQAGAQLCGLLLLYCLHSADQTVRMQAEQALEALVAQDLGQMMLALVSEMANEQQQEVCTVLLLLVNCGLADASAAYKMALT
jgi:hypothetical protein